VVINKIKITRPFRFTDSSKRTECDSVAPCSCHNIDSQPWGFGLGPFGDPPPEEHMEGRSRSGAPCDRNAELAQWGRAQGRTGAPTPPPVFGSIRARSPFLAASVSTPPDRPTLRRGVLLRFYADREKHAQLRRSILRIDRIVSIRPLRIRAFAIMR
jgi:hypothetical protein